ncbi:MAG: SelB C-terminal domain-containing protein, partial [Treponema sp.]|nr:SelB C-terminal domain-containing protein [Treponema sp.]
MDRAGFAESLDLLAGQAADRRIVEFGKSRAFIAAAAFDAVAGAVRAILKKFHADNPELSGLEPDKLYSALEAVKGGSDVSQADFKSLITIMEEKGIIAGIELQGRSLCRAVDFNHAPDDRFTALADRVRRAIDGAGFNLLTVPDLEAGLKLAPAELKRALSFLREREDLRIIEGGLLFSRTVRRNLIDRLAGMSGDITVASLRDAIGVSRKYTMPMLEFLDSQGITRREGDRRILQKDG